MPTPKCPPGTLCLTTGTATALVVIVAMAAYIAYLTWTNATTKAKADTPSVFAEDHDVAALLPATRSAPKPSAAVEPPSLQRAPQVTTNIYQSASYADPMLRPPLRRYVDTYDVPGVPINVPTRGPTPDVQQVGTLSNEEAGTVLALYGRPTFRGSSKWLYYTGTDKYHSIKLPVERSGRNCTDEHGCDELMDDDPVTVKGQGGPFKVSVYNLDAPRYIPYVV